MGKQGQTSQLGAVDTHSMLLKFLLVICAPALIGQSTHCFACWQACWHHDKEGETQGSL